jgi:hypothetical protein
VRKIALLDAMDDTDGGEFSKDENVTLSPEDLYWAGDDATGWAGAVWFDESSNAIIYSQDNATDFQLTIEPAMVGVVDEFDTDNTLWMYTGRECNFTGDVNANLTYDAVCDYNGDSAADPSATGNDDDLLVVFYGSDDLADEFVVVDLTDRGYDEGITYQYKNGINLYEWFVDNATANAAALVAEIDSDEDTLLIAPFLGATFTIDWGVDNKIDQLDICYPTKTVDATYFLGIGEEATYVEDTVTKEDEGTEVSAGCCTFKVKEFSVDVGDATGQQYTTSTVNKIIGRMVVPEVGADTTKNLVIVGGPSVNGMCTVTKEEIEAEADKFVVKKDGNLLIVAGYEYEETLAAGDALIEWLNANVHA